MLLWSGLGRFILGSIVRGFEESFYPEVLPEMDLRIVGTSSRDSRGMGDARIE